LFWHFVSLSQTLHALSAGKQVPQQDTGEKGNVGTGLQLLSARSRFKLQVLELKTVTVTQYNNGLVERYD